MVVEDVLEEGLGEFRVRELSGMLQGINVI
jgi:hypothetical protein